MNRPSRETAAGRAYLDLQARARRDGRPTDELLVLYVLERATMRHADWDRFVTRSGLTDRVPFGYNEAIEEVVIFADPIVTGEITSGAWNPADRAWTID